MRREDCSLRPLSLNLLWFRPRGPIGEAFRAEALNQNPRTSRAHGVPTARVALFQIGFYLYVVPSGTSAIFSPLIRMTHVLFLLNDKFSGNGSRSRNSAEVIKAGREAADIQLVSSRIRYCYAALDATFSIIYLNIYGI